MKVVFKSLTNNSELMSLAMLDIISNAMAGIAVLFFLHTALQLQDPPPVVVKGRLIFHLKMQDLSTGATAPVVYFRNEEGTYFFDAEINNIKELELEPVREDRPSFVFDRCLFKVKKYPNQWEIHLLDPNEGNYRAGLIYTDHQKFEQQQVSTKVHLSALFESNTSPHQYQTRTIKRTLKSPTEKYEIEVAVKPEMASIF